MGWSVLRCIGVLQSDHANVLKFFLCSLLEVPGAFSFKSNDSKYADTFKVLTLRYLHGCRLCELHTKIIPFPYSALHFGIWKQTVRDARSAYSDI